MDKNLMEIKEADILKHYTSVFGLVTDFSYTPKAKKDSGTEEVVSDTTYVRRTKRSHVSGIKSTGSKSSVALMDTIEGVDGDDPLITEIQSHMIRVIRRAMAIASEVVDVFGNSTNLNRLKEANGNGRVSEIERIEFQELLNTASLIGLFVTTSYVTFILSDYMTDSDTMQISIDPTEEIVIDNPVIALKGALWELDDNIKKYAKDDITLVRVVKDYFAQLMAELQIRKSGIRHAEVFIDNNYRVEEDKFDIIGFDTAKKGKSTKLIMQFVRPDQVVGNHIAKYQALKLAKMVALYDFTRQRNPILDVAGFPLGVIGDGNPGTGKTTLYQMFCGLVNDYAQAQNRPFVVEVFTPDMISSYQGKTAQNAKQALTSGMDPHVFGSVLFDDVDQTTASRGDDKASAGQQEVTSVLMETLAGANTIIRGNASAFLFSNYPEKVDDALRQRCGLRWLVDGPQTLEDYQDILALLLGKNHTLDLGGIELYTTQDIKKAIGRSYEKHNRPTETALIEVFDRVVDEQGELNTIEKVGIYLKAIQGADPRFTGRSIKNITDTCKMRSADFEVPDEWVENPEVFVELDYDRKVDMLKELVTPITSEMVLQETNRYADSEFRYSDKSDEAEIVNMVRYHHNKTEADKRIRND